MKLPRSGAGRAVAGGHRARRPGAAADDPHPRVRASDACGESRLRRPEPSPGAPLRVLVAPDSFKGSLTSVDGRAGARRRLASGPTDRRRSSSCRWRTAAKARSTRSRPRRRLARAAGSRARPSGTAISGHFLRRATTPSSSWPRPPGSRGSLRRARPDGGVDLRHGPDPGGGHRARRAERRPRAWAAAPRPMAAAGCCGARGALPRCAPGTSCARGGGPLGRLARVDLSDVCAGARRGDADDRLRRHQPAAWASAAQRRRTGRRRARRAAQVAELDAQPGALRRPARGGGRPRDPRRARGRRGGWHDRGAAGDRRPLRRRSRSGPASRCSWS